MMPIKFVFVFLVALFTFSSCATIQLRNMHRREIRAELDRYSDVLNFRRSEIRVSGRRYGAMMGSPSIIILRLHLRPGYKNHETVNWIRDGLIDFFNKNMQDARGEIGFGHPIWIELFCEEGRFFYFLELERQGWGWRERWRDYAPKMLPIAR